MSKFKKLSIVVILILFIILIVSIAGFNQIRKNMKSYESFSFETLNLSQIEDGVYNGSEDGEIVKATVAVTVENHRIKNVRILSHECGKGKPAEVIVDDIVANNSLVVDTISGATYSSNVIKAAVYQALSNN